MGSTNTGATVLNRLISDGELAKVMTNHLGADFDLIISLAIVNTHDGSNHLREDDHITKMGFHNLGYLCIMLIYLQQAFRQQDTPFCFSVTS